MSPIVGAARTTVLVLSGLLALSGCASKTGAPGAQGAKDRVAVVEGLAGPEGVRYDPDQDVYFISNFNGNSAGDSNGFISRVSAEGEIEVLKYMVGSEAVPLHGPRGMFIVGDTLWAADAAGLHGFDRKTGAFLSFIDFSSFNPGFLNDVSQAPNGDLYVTDTGPGRLYRVVGGAPELVTDLATKPNGITWDEANGYFVLAPWSSRDIVSIAPGETEVHTIATSPADNVDGLEIVGTRLLLSIQGDQRIYAVENGVSTVIIETVDKPADIGIDTKRNRIAVPYVAANRVDIWAL